MFDKLLEGIFESAGVHDDEQKAEYLVSLQEPASKFWKCYQTQYVQALYAKQEIQDAYLLRYFPFYSRLLPEVLKKNTVHLPKKKHLVATFFGCGPAPELIGLLDFLQEEKITARVEANLIDSASDDWAHARNIGTEFAISQSWIQKSDIHALHANIADRKIFAHSDILARIRRSDLVVFQNCLNEINEPDRPVMLENIKRTFEELPANSIGIIIDLEGYQKRINDVIHDLSQWSLDSPLLEDTTCEKEQEFSCRSMLTRVPPIIDRNLFWRTKNHPERNVDDGLCFRGKIPYRFLAFRRNERILPETCTRDGEN